jgi:uncharacterized membrane protein YidH (DUF202 family)
MSIVNALAITVIVLMIGVAIGSRIIIKRANERRLMYWITGASLSFTITDRAIIWFVTAGGQIDLGAIGLWLFYFAVGAAVVVGVGAALRNGGTTRFAWRQGRYQKYRQYRRI